MLSIFHKAYIANMVITTDAFMCNTCTQASVDHGSPAVRAAVRQDTPSKLPAQLSFWIFIRHESDVYIKVLFRCEKSPPVLRFAMRSIPVASQAKTSKKSPFYTRFGSRRNGYWSHRKTENGRWFFASKYNFFVYITFVCDKYPET